MSASLLLVAFIILVALLFDYINGFHDAANSIATRSAHALIGGFAGAAVVKAGFGSLIYSGLGKILVFIVLAPLLGLVLSFSLMVGVYWIFRRTHPGRVDGLFRRLQLVSAAAYSLGHGTNDAQKTMGIIAILLFSAGYLGSEFYVPFWVILAAHAAIALGTLAGGWRIVKTMGMRLAKRPAGALMLTGPAVGVTPVSPTHTITGSIVGVGATQRISAVRWGLAGRIIWAWILTIPLSALLAGAAWLILPPRWGGPPGGRR